MAELVADWETVTVIEFFKEIKLDKFTKELTKAKVDGKQLLKIRENSSAIKGVKKKDDIRKIQEALNEKIFALENDEHYNYDGFGQDEFEPDIDSGEDYDNPEEMFTPQSRASRVLPPLPGEDKDDTPPKLMPRTGGTRQPPPPRGFHGKPPPNVPVVTPIVLKKTTPQIPQRTQPNIPVLDEEYEELPGQEQSTAADSSEEEYLTPDASMMDCQSIPTTRAPDPPKQQVIKQHSNPTNPISQHVQVPTRSKSERGDKDLGIKTLVLRTSRSNLRKTAQDAFIKPEEDNCEGPSVDPSTLSMKEKIRLAQSVSDRKLSTLPAARPPRKISEPSNPMQRERKTSSSSNQSFESQASPRRPPEPLPKPTKHASIRDSGVSLTSNASGRSKQNDMQYDRKNTLLRPESTISSDSSFSEGSYRSQKEGSCGVENSSGITVATRPKLKNKYHQPSVESLEWFHGHIQQRTEADAKLKNLAPGENGAFLVRVSPNKEYQPYTLMVVHENQVKNIAISVRPTKGFKFALGTEKLDEELFDSVESLISFHKYNDIIVTDQQGRQRYVTLGQTPPKL